MKKIVSVLSFLLILMLLISACGKKQAPTKVSFNDSNCIIGNESLAQDGTYIGKFSKITTKAKMINVKIGKLCSTIKFNDKTGWKWGNKVNSIKELRKKSGVCIAIKTVKQGDKIIATEIKVLPPYKVPADMLVDNAGLKKLMNGIPNTNKALTIVDNRPKGKFIQGSIPGAINIPMPALKKGPGFTKLPENKKSLIVFYCGGFHCKLSPFSATLAIKKGYTNIKVYHAGYPDWKKNLNPGFVSPKFVSKKIKTNMPLVLIDIRANAKKSHIPGAIAFNKSNLNTYKAQFPKGKDKKRALIVVYGKDKTANKESFELASAISKMGYKNVTVLKGGFAAYAKSGKTASSKLVSKINYVHKNPPGFVSAKEFVAMIKNKIPADVMFIDVREKSEVADEPGMKLLGAKNIPLSQLSDEASKLDKTKKYFMFCSSGARAEIGREQLSGKKLQAFYVASPVEGYQDEGISFGEKIKISSEMINKINQKRLLN